MATTGQPSCQLQGKQLDGSVSPQETRVLKRIAEIDADLGKRQPGRYYGPADAQYVSKLMKERELLLEFVAPGKAG